MSKQHKVGMKVYLFLLGVAIAGITFYMYNGFHSSIRINEQIVNGQESSFLLTQNQKLKNEYEENSNVEDTNSLDSSIKNQMSSASQLENTADVLKGLQDVSEQSLFNETLKDPTVRKIVPYKLGDQNINWVEWENRCVMPTDMNIQYQNFAPFICSRSNAIDIGAHSGDTAVAIAAATYGGTTYAYEPHPKTYHILSLQGKLNPKINLKTFNIALMKDSRNKMWWNGVGDGCNGGIQGTSCGKTSKQCMEIKSENVASHFNKASKEFIERLSFIKVDTEGNDRYILRGLKDSILQKVRPLILIEWFVEFKGCNDAAKDMFNAIKEIDYTPYGYTLTLQAMEKTVATCDKYFTDLLLVPNEIDINSNGIKVCPN